MEMSSTSVMIVPFNLRFQDLICRCALVPLSKTTNSIPSLISGCVDVCRLRVGWYILSSNGTSSEVVRIYVLVDMSTLSNSTFRCDISGLSNASLFTFWIERHIFWIMVCRCLWLSCKQQRQSVTLNDNHLFINKI